MGPIRLVSAILLGKMARPGRIELPTLCLEACFGAVAIKGPMLIL